MNPVGVRCVVLLRGEEARRDDGQAAGSLDANEATGSMSF